MSVDGFYSVQRRGTSPEALFRSLCRDHGVDAASVHLEPRSFADLDACVSCFGLCDAFTQITCELDVDDADADVVARLAGLPPLPPPADELEALTLRYEHTTATTELWQDLGKKRRTAVDLTLAVGIDVPSSAVALAVRLDISRVSRVSSAELAEIQGWWRRRHHAFLDERLARLGERGTFDLDVNEPTVTSGSPAVSIVREWGHLLYPVVLVARPRDALATATRTALAGLGARRLVVLATGAASRLTALRAWLPPPTRIHGPAIFDPLPLATLELPTHFTGEASLSASLGDHDDDAFGGDLMLFLGEAPRLVLAVRPGLLPAKQKRLEKTLGVQLRYEHG